MMATAKAPAKKKTASKAVAVADGKPQILGWSDPPPSRKTASKKGTKYQSMIDELIANPGKPALIMEDANTASAQPFRDAGCRLFTRQLGDGNTRVNIWAVYDPDNTYVPPSGQVEATGKTTPVKATAKKTVSKKVAPKKAPVAAAKKPRPKAAAK